MQTHISHNNQHNQKPEKNQTKLGARDTAKVSILFLLAMSAFLSNLYKIVFLDVKLSNFEGRRDEY